MKTQEEQIQEKIEIIISNFITEAHNFKTLIDLAGKEKQQTKIGMVSLTDLVNLNKLDAKGFIMLIGLMGRTKEVFGDIPADVIDVVCLELYGSALDEELKEIFV